jgi:signal transduction histidine kinase
MKTSYSIKKFQKSLSKGLELLSKGDSKATDFLKKIKEHLNTMDKRIPESDLITALYVTLLKENHECKKKLRDVTNSYDEVLGLITHEFKNILTSIHGYNMLLENQLDLNKDKEILHHLRDSDRLTRQLFDMTDSLLKMSLGEKGLIKPELKLVDFVDDLFTPLQRDVELQLVSKQMKIILKSQNKNLIVECDEGLLDIVIRNLLINAIKYGKQNTEIVVNIDRTKKDFEFAIRNYSDEIPSNLCNGIFDKFKSREIGDQKGGTGIGLYNVRNIIQLHRGKITCKCSAKKWIEFKLSIPQNI